MLTIRECVLAWIGTSQARLFASPAPLSVQPGDQAKPRRQWTGSVEERNLPGLISAMTSTLSHHWCPALDFSPGGSLEVEGNSALQQGGMGGQAGLFHSDSLNTEIKKGSHFEMSS